MFSPQQIPQLATAHIPKVRTDGQMVFHKLLGNLRKEYLPTVSGCHQPCHTAKSGTVVITVPFFGVAGMQCHAHT
jgi:hypothetical protein